MADSRIFRPAHDSTATPTHPDWVTWRDIDPSDRPAISVIVPAGDNDEDLERRLPEVLRQTMNPHEVVIVDTSTDGRHFPTVARFDQAEGRTVIRYVRSAAPGRRALRALATRLAAGNIKAFAWAGSVLPPTWVERIANGVQQLRAVAVAIV